MRSKESFLSKLENLVGSNKVWKDKEDFKIKLTNMVEDGVDNLQFVVDFDDTLTKYIVDGKRGLNSFSMFGKTKTLTKDYADRVKGHLSKLEPDLFKANLEPDKQVLFDGRVADLMSCSVGEKVGIADIHEAVEQIDPFKEGCKEFLSLLSDLQVPLTVVSGGSGDVIKYFLKDSNAKVVANFLNFQDNLITELIKPSVGMYNKHKLPLPIDKNRSNIVVMGDCAWDSKIADNVANVKDILKIGYYYGRQNESIQQHLNYFDVLLVDDETMNVASVILKLIARKA